MEKFLNTPLHYGRKSMIDIENMKYIVEQEIKKCHFESLQYVLFDENKRLPWAFHLFYRDGKFMINSRDDRSYVIGNTVEFNSFEEAKADFINTLENYVEMNIQGKELGFTPEYPSPLWDEDENDAAGRTLRDEKVSCYYCSNSWSVCAGYLLKAENHERATRQYGHPYL